MPAVAVVAGVLAAIAMLQCVAGWIAVVRFVHRPRRDPRARPAVSILKPLAGDEPLLEAALATVCRIRYPAYQIVFGVQDPADPAAGVVRRLQSRFPGRDIALVVDPTQHGANRKVSNLINMLPFARYELLVIADSDLHVAADYLDRLVAALEAPATGLATTLYVGRPAAPHLPARLGATQITHSFLPGALLARAMGREDCLGATMALRSDILRRIGGFEALLPHLADDNALGRLVQGLGLSVALADTAPLTTVPEASFGELFRHELRWARTIRALVPGAFAASALQYPIFWALLALLLTPLAAWTWLAVALAWAVRATAARGIGRALGQIVEVPLPPAPLWCLPLREVMSIAVMLASYAGLRVDWRGHSLTADGPARPSATEKEHTPE